MILAFKINYLTVAFVILCIMFVLLLLYIIFKRVRYKKSPKKLSKKLSKKFSYDSDNLENLIQKTHRDDRYKGTYKSFRHRTKKAIKKFMKKWLEKIPVAITIIHKGTERKYKKLSIYTTNEYHGEQASSQWNYKPNKNWKYNFKKLVKFMNKNKIALGTIDVIARIYDDEKSGEVLETRYCVKENETFVTYGISKKKIARK